MSHLDSTHNDYYQYYHDLYYNDLDNVYLYDVRTIFHVVTDLLTPGYILLSFVAVASRYNNILKLLASHGKTSTSTTTVGTTATKATIFSSSSSTSSSWSSWYWISKRNFVHFYLVGLLSTAIITTCHYYDDYYYYNNIQQYCADTTKIKMKTKTAPTIIAVVLLVIHLVRRAYECIYVQRYRKESSKMHVAGYALGVGYYLVLPLVFWGTTIDANKKNDNGNCSSSASDIISASTTTTRMLGIFIFGMIVVNLWLQYEQHKHHVILADIRRVAGTTKKRNHDDDDDDDDCTRLQNQHHSLPPHRRWFRYVLSPHYLAEILLYLSFAIILETAVVHSDLVCTNNSSSSSSISSNKNIDKKNVSFFLFGRILLSIGRRYRHWMLFVWVATNLTVSALNSYEWYHSRYFYSNSNSNNCKRKDNGTNNKDNSGNHRLARDDRDQRAALFPKIW